MNGSSPLLAVAEGSQVSLNLIINLLFSCLSCYVINLHSIAEYMGLESK